MEFLPEAIDQYTHKYTRTPSALLQELERETFLKIPMPRMLSGHLQGQTLRMLVAMMQPKHILEVGTYTGYSALVMAEALPPDGKITTIDVNLELEKMVRGYFAKSPQASQIHFHVGDASEIIPTLKEQFDMVFIDADKENYLNYYHLAFDQVPIGGFIIADNVLWSGKVADEAAKDKDTQAIRQYNEAIHNDPRVENLLLPVRDGLMIARKIAN